MDEETLFKMVYIASRAGESDARWDQLQADADSLWDQFQEFRGTVSQFVEIESTNPSGIPGWCGLCDSAHCTGHPQKRCERCGVKGLSENMTAERHRCKV